MRGYWEKRHEDDGAEWHYILDGDSAAIVSYDDGGSDYDEFWDAWLGKDHLSWPYGWKRDYKTQLGAMNAIEAYFDDPGSHETMRQFTKRALAGRAERMKARTVFG